MTSTFGNAFDPEFPEPVGIFENRDGVRVYVEQDDLIDHDDPIEHDHGGHKAHQAAHFDLLAEAEFETVRPHGTPRFHQFLLAEKSRRATRAITDLLSGRSALVVCGGSGMDAEFLARAGACVVSSDISLGAARRAVDRFGRYGLKAVSIVADVEHLPFTDGSFDLVAVHDGLHHLSDPYVGMAEMARVAKRWVIVSEPAQAAATQMAVRLGWAVEREDAGNRVARLRPSEVAAFFESRGFRVVTKNRYAMYYQHHPGFLARVLSARGVYGVARFGWFVLNGIVGRFGNKMVVVAERTESADLIRHQAR